MLDDLKGSLERMVSMTLHDVALLDEESLKGPLEMTGGVYSPSGTGRWRCGCHLVFVSLGWPPDLFW